MVISRKAVRLLAQVDAVKPYFSFIELVPAVTHADDARLRILREQIAMHFGKKEWFEHSLMEATSKCLCVSCFHIPDAHYSGRKYNSWPDIFLLLQLLSVSQIFEGDFLISFDDHELTEKLYITQEHLISIE